MPRTSFPKTKSTPSKRVKNYDNSGKYIPDEDKWAYKPDKSGKYKHVHVPYNGGYGPWVSLTAFGEENRNMNNNNYRSFED